MKKLMIVLAVVGMAAVSQAVQFKWNTTTGIVAAGETAKMQNGGTAYLIDALSANGGISQVAFLQALTAETPKSFADLVASYSIKSTSVGTDGKLTQAIWDDPKMPDGETAYVGNTKGTMYVVLQDGDNIFISNSLADKTIQATSATTWSYALKSQSSSGKIADAKAGFTSGGWYAAAPEPTSGLLLLLGVAGLALRRRRA